MNLSDNIKDVHYSFHDIIHLLHESLRRFAGTFHCSVQQLSCVTTNLPLMRRMTFKFAQAVSLFHIQRDIFQGRSSTPPGPSKSQEICQEQEIREELKHFLDQVLLHMLEEYVEGEMTLLQQVLDVHKACQDSQTFYLAQEASISPNAVSSNAGIINVPPAELPSAAIMQSWAFEDTNDMNQEFDDELFDDLIEDLMND